MHASSVAYALQEIIEERPGKDREKNVLFFDIGGSSVEASVAVIESGIVEIRAVIGHPHLGGEDFDENMILHPFNTVAIMSPKLESKCWTGPDKTIDVIEDIRVV